MGRLWICAWVVLVAACVEPQLRQCPTVDCPMAMVCDGHGGCAMPEQLAQCLGQDEGAACSYSSQANVRIDGACAGGVCRQLGCGNGILTPNETCDDGNTINGDGCSADCQSAEKCGNGHVDPARGEQCDDGNTASGDGCQDDCKLPRCGDGIADPSLSEQCDAGDANSAAPDAPCRTNCQLPRCGDGVVDPLLGEVCDDNNNQSADGCSGDCRSDETCGNSITDALAGEICDDGNTDSDDGCSGDCRSLEVCGDGVINPGKGEICDDGNTVSGDGCSSDCKSLEVCGNGIVDTSSEQCDLAGANSNAPDAQCRTNCRLRTCGDSIVDPINREQCDDGMMNAEAPNACRTNCQNPRCGDGIQDTGEICDDGNTTSGDGCSADCHSLETCGNGIVDIAKGELCDAGMMNSNNPDAPCRPDCRPPRCGDGVRDILLGEGCDAGMANSNAPGATCRPNCQLARCGDTIVDTAAGEVCDDGNATAGDGCSADCRSNETCGNGIVDVVTGEQCDAAAMNSNAPNASCRPNCRVQRCGDGIHDTLLGEGCDAGAANSNAANAACRPSCQPRRCGDGIRDTLTEVCDDNNTLAGDGCSPDCQSDETCGNGVVDFIAGEQCDDNNSMARDGCSACRPEAAIVLTPNGAPNKRDSHALVYDGARRKVVMYGGWTADGNLADTWEWDGISWTQIFTSRAPGPRLDAAIAYDPKRKRVVLFGGFSANYTGYRGDTWEYDGVNWTQRTLPSNPPPTAAAAMAYDGVRGALLLYGGQSGDSTQPTATWSYDGTTWTRLTPAAHPGTREGHRMVWNAASGYVMLFGGGNNRTWTWNGTAWTDRGASTVASSGYNSNAMVFDANRQKVVMWDGTANVTWEWNAQMTRWDSTTAPTPPARSYISAAYDAARRQVVLFGGYGTVGTVPNENFADTWLRGPSTTVHAWTQPPPFVEPANRTAAGATYDPLRKRVVAFGGMGTSGDLAETWEWDGRQWQQIAATTPPTARDAAKLVYNTAARNVMLFGGDALVDLYTYNGTAWTAAAMSSGRTPTRNTPMTYDAARDRLVTFAGRDDAPNSTRRVLDTTWRWHSTTGWQLVTSAQEPPGRKGHGIAYDHVRQRTVLFGGFDDATTALSDVWEFDGTSWERMESTVGPNARTGLHVLYNPDARRVVVFGNSGGFTGEDLWEWTAAGWNQRQVLGTIPSRYRATIAYDAANHALVTFGGRDTNFNHFGTTRLLAYWPNTAVEACTSSQVDYDNDGKLGCADEDCWAQCTPLCAPGTTCPTGAPRCGDGTCQPNEDCAICPSDCGACTGTCGDFHCNSGETATNCPSDCF
jgi:cysteine-rich repeat protein